MNIERLNRLETKLENWKNLSCTANHPCNLPAFQNLVKHIAAQVNSLPDAAMTQQRLQDFEKLLVAIKLSPALKLCQFARGKRTTTTTEVKDPWDEVLRETEDEAEEGENKNVSEKFDAKTFQAALSFYGLSKEWPRVFSKGGVDGSFIKTTASDAAKNGNACWVQVNEPVASAPLTKAKNADIAIVRNVTLDFEFAAAPHKVHAVALELASWLVEQGYAEPGLPVEDSGAGAHIILPIVDIITNQVEGGAQRVNYAIKRIVEREFNPAFQASSASYGLTGKIELDCYDISRIISAPGTWRPAKADQVVAHHSLKNGYQRRWLAPYDNGNLYPTRKPSSKLSNLILVECASIKAEEEATRAKVIEMQSYRKEANSQKLQQAANYVRTALDGEKLTLSSMRQGGRNNAANKAAFRMGSLAAGGLPVLESEVKMELVSAAQQAGLSKHEAEQAVNSGWRAGLNRPANVELKEYEAS